MKKVLFIDRDGTIVKEPPVDYQLDSYEKLEFLPVAITQLHRIARELDYELVMVTNQDGLGTDSFPEDTFWPVHNLMMNVLENEGINFSEVLIDRSFPEQNAPTRKPQTGLLTHYIKGNYDLENSFVIGDRNSDMQLAKNLGCKGIQLPSITDDSTFEDELVVLKTESWKEIFEFLKGQPRKVTVSRKTNETDINIVLNLDGSGNGKIDTGLKFYDHMLEQLQRHGSLDLDIKVNGDLEIDEHHTIEDTAIALGDAFAKALSSKKGINRYGFLLPMDDSLAQVGIDFGGRPWIVWEAEFKREYVGDMPTELFFHFFKSFSDAAKCNLNMKVEGDNEHHKIESLFKAFAKAIKMAVKQTGDGKLPSTKGTL
ncbi:imidazoleglycerol-phosphate dehydratase [Nonlabens xylanidelens]|uniref:Histidine biosynthesis bifunctional protein HisB n=1 Tax=Nonlabens xylanidelens TaxID=191564 RepID=A0A2S6IJI4_9FLAO|nr:MULTISPECIES: bifunctional histidinol-phosphatase/imidazoleglycerol-phosphate dehydratase HisB [Nonlabens]PPK94394.1 imidazoleglycerol-phosphate dehydratase [Nonlabens xylanidelens]PQJ21444.1 bifunctional imidazole glycerol-phosphate dehydratase/histidinol phosphatase [Nonlabens xylanidelens]WOI21764.1 bifunctional histidinol-phosphatase/imidazoleglycerol-phosphate dehydratase HisB [Nonlabens ulvanivorans]